LVDYCCLEIYLLFGDFYFIFMGFSGDGIHLALAGENSTLSLAITTLGRLKFLKP
jgi:hypothetical protein